MFRLTIFLILFFCLPLKAEICDPHFRDLPEKLNPEIKNEDLANKVYMPLMRKEISQDQAKLAFIEEMDKDLFYQKLSAKMKDQVAQYILGRQTPLFDLKYLKFRFQLEAKGVDPDARPESFAQIATSYGYVSLEHITSVDYIFDILKSRALTPSIVNGNRLGGGKKEFVYLRAVQKKKVAEDVDEAIIQLDLAVLDKNQWTHANPDTYEGEFIANESILPSNMLGFIFQNSDRAHGLSLGSGNEFMFPAEVPLGGPGFSVSLKPKARADLLKRLEDENIPPPANRTWAEVIGD